MKPFFLLLICCLFIKALTAQTTAAKLEEYMDAAYKAKLFNGVVLAARNDTLLLAKGYGWRDYEKHLPHDTNSIFRIGSVTKPFTAVVILYLQEHGLLKITDTLSKYFPEYGYGKKITIKSLLTHTSGIIEYSNQDNFFEELAYKPYTQSDFWKFIKDEPLDFEPGAEYSYSNSNYFILGYLIEKVTGKPYEQNVREIIFNKAGMRHSGFDFKNLQSKYKTIGYDILNDSVHIPARIADSSAAYAAGGIYTTVGDMYRWHKALMTNTIISRQSLEEAFTPYLEGYGYGWNIQQTPNGRFVCHKGGIMGFQALFAQMPENNLCFIVFSNDYNIREDPERELNFIGQAFLQILFQGNQAYYIPRIAIQSNDEALKEYIGQYKKDTTLDYIITITLNDHHLYSSLNNRPASELFEEKKDFFFLKSINCQLEFKRDADGKIKELVVYYNKQTARYRKIK